MPSVNNVVMINLQSEDHDNILIAVHNIGSISVRDANTCYVTVQGDTMIINRSMSKLVETLKQVGVVTVDW